MEVLPEHEGPAMPMQNGGLDFEDTGERFNRKDRNGRNGKSTTESRRHGEEQVLPQICAR